VEPKKIEYYNRKKKSPFKLIVGLSIVLLIIIFVIISFKGKGTITGRQVAEGVNINSELSITPLELEGSFKKVEIRGSYNNYFNVGGERFDLSKSGNLISLENFEGSISINGKTINLLEGNAQIISINGVQIKPESTLLLNTKVEDFKFTSLEIEDGVNIEKLSYNTTGIINIENKKTTLNLKDEAVVLSKFYGSLVIEENVMRLDGQISEISTQGKSKVSISS
jgi:hypothetical protein